MPLLVNNVFDDSNNLAQGAVVVSVPHAGRDYPTCVAARLALPLQDVRVLEDRLADRVAFEALQRGHRIIIARTPRLMIDLNRAETDFDPATITGAVGTSAQPSARARGGLGLIPDRLWGLGNLWNEPITAAELASRIKTFHRPYHDALERALTRAHARHGSTLLVDLHSMPPLAGRHAADVVIGDRLGKTAAPEIVEAARAHLSDSGLRVAINTPYAGGHIIERHAAPHAGRHAIQIEFDRRLYLDAKMVDVGPRLGQIDTIFADMIDKLGRLIAPFPAAIAAE